MGLFDFHKPKKDPMEIARKLVSDPKFKPSEIQAETDMVASRVSNLKSVARDDEAEELSLEFLGRVFGECLSERYHEHPKMLTAFADAAIRLEQPEYGKKAINAVIQMNLDKGPIIDLTTLYFDVGRMCHNHTPAEEELWYYHSAIECVAPPKCLNPATNREKAIANDFAYHCAFRSNREDLAELYDRNRRKLAPDCDFDNLVAYMEWMKGLKPV
jgi:hypothetical protein